MEISSKSVRNKMVAVIGCGKTGIGVANLLASWGGNVSMYDEKSKDSLDCQSLLPTVKLFGGPISDALTKFKLIVKSPGVPGTVPALQKATAAGAEVIGELEVVSAYLPKPIIAITGTNGKTSVTSLTGQALKNEGRAVFVGGNIGISMAENIPAFNAFDSSVLELSSFQLEDTKSFHPQIAVLLNITPDHLNRHSNMQEYIRCKSKIFANQEPRDTAILNADDPAVTDIIKRLRSKVLLFSLRNAVPNGAYVNNGVIVTSDDGIENPLVHLDELSAAGCTNIENLMAMALAAASVGVSPAVVRETMLNFNGFSHRIEHIAQINGINFINDSKGTNVGAVEMSLKSLAGPIILIAGGRDKDGDFRPLKQIIDKKVKTLFLIGEAKEKIQKQVDFQNTVLCSSLKEATLAASDSAENGDSVLLSPACASFDMFAGYEDRGRQFKVIVEQLAKSGEPSL